MHVHTYSRLIVCCLALTLACSRGGAVETVQLTSDVLERAEYRPDARALTLFFDDGSTYRYADVPPAVFAGLRSGAASPGVYFNASIRNNFVFERLTPPTRRPRRETPAADGSAAVSRPSVPCATTMTKRPLVSTVLETVAYDPATKCLELAFDSKHVYRYGGVAPDEYQQLLRSDGDPGTYFNAVIRRKYKDQTQRVR
jgi:hypothetical protein